MYVYKYVHNKYNINKNNMHIYIRIHIYCTDRSGEDANPFLMTPLLYLYPAERSLKKSKHFYPETRIHYFYHRSPAIMPET